MQPIPLNVIRHALTYIFQDQRASPGLQAAGDLISSAFYFLMRPGEYCHAPEAHPFRYQDVDFAHDAQRLDVASCTEQALLDSTGVVVTYNDQKNANRGEKIGQGRSGDPWLCAVTSLARRIIHLRRNRAPRDTPIYTYYNASGQAARVSSATITQVLRRSARLLGLSEDEVSNIHARALRATGASALLHAQIDSDLIRLLGRWKSDTMLRYLHAQSAGITRNFAALMVTHGAADNPLTRRAPPSPRDA